MDYYIPVEIIEKQITFLKELEEKCGKNDAIDCAINNLRIVNSHNNRVDSGEIYHQQQREYFEDDVRQHVDEWIESNADRYENVEYNDLDIENMIERFYNWQDHDDYESYGWEYAVNDYLRNKFTAKE